MIEPLRLSLVVGCSCEAAFRTWTERTGLWWPTDHTATGDADSVVTFEPFVGGRVYERTPGGSEVDWGRIVVWEPPRRLAYLWHLRVDRADATDVEITFTVDEGDHCRVEIEHRGWERLGDLGLRRRDANQQGWAGLLPHFVAACRGPEASAPRASSPE
ncbi:MAG: SRPBCC domain-containing protein [Actinobacteria bacterium]|nr:SRPBCC domain-containing protein [Actinomycetota bacterium]